MPARSDSHPARRPPALVDGLSSIRVVSELTAIPMGTLRAWERRYDFPNPARRKNSNRRVYSAAEVEQLRDVARALQRGYRPADVIHMPPGQLRALLATVPEAADASVPVAAVQPGLGHAVADVPTLMALVARDDVQAVEAELRFTAAALGAKRFVTECAQPLAQAMGQAWAEGKLAIRHEHLLTQCLSTQLRSLLAQQQDADGSPTILLSSLPGEPHTLGLEMVALYLALSAAKPRLLGASTPTDQIISAARGLHASAVGIAVTPALSPDATRAELQRLARGLPRSVALWVGGSGTAELLPLPRRAEALVSWPAIDAALARARAR
jgi:MerR family transcriptional regulator, light-induced transcriptional regulator